MADCKSRQDWPWGQEWRVLDAGAVGVAQRPVSLPSRQSVREDASAILVRSVPSDVLVASRKGLQQSV